MSTPTTTPSAKITSLDHLVLTVHSIPLATAWYSKHLGMRHESFVSFSTPSITRHSLIFGSQKINLHESGHEFEPKALNVKPGSADLCFLTDDRVQDVRKRLVEAGVEMVDLKGEEDGDGTVIRTGARGRLRSVYCRDEDGNLVE
ncbi:Glyoxalase/Bleomycin resistance protein/Dihydroxybiphenyl dioxygenase [Mollisia scopiformis]|uniref:Glyoxalase/Bleomycin resistance protein/Dihydroxybiphenyl dioxygenase n=1 Tax=Mollisia scopiformis TaxID=149040 RepID=A0A132BBF0_MOLSC|nr:Glyoxalase/Bleomycin resistance protein/Dihydroxybiphenyl dioxygenase [Mollisia scopiformis]KUJ09752.1 Glyoxalase/Bleomycin resistance protein/Dihydroxybiphenyl dioxygenase [Mollisia scopiformis]